MSQNSATETLDGPYKVWAVGSLVQGLFGPAMRLDDKFCQEIMLSGFHPVSG